MKFLPNLYVLRFALALLVVLHHIPLICITFKIPYYNNLPILRKGELCVFYFFALSGFLIIRLVYIEMKKTNGFNFKRFYLRRIQRLYPAYYMVLFVGVALYHFVLPTMGIPYRGDYNLIDLLLNYILLIPNIFKYYHYVGSILLILWSIGVEEQFYLFMPIFMFIFKRKLLLSISLLLFLLLMLIFIFPSFYKYWNYYFYFLGGGLLSCLNVQKNIPALNNKIIHIVTYSFFILSFTTDLFNFEHRYLYHLFNLIISSLLISLISDYPIFIFKNKVIDYLGKISYGIYVYHAIIITGVIFLTSKFKPYNLMNQQLFIIILNLLIVILTIIFAHISFKYFESRFYKVRN